MKTVVMIVNHATTASPIGGDTKDNIITLARAIRHLRPGQDLQASVEAAREADHSRKSRCKSSHRPKLNSNSLE